MKKQTMLAVFLTTTLVSVNAFAMHHEGAEHTHEGVQHAHEGEAPVVVQSESAVTQKEPSATIHVNGLVCDFCAQAIKKVFKKQEAVEDIDVNLTDKLIKVWFKEGASVDAATLTKMVTDAGYSVVSIETK